MTSPATVTQAVAQRDASPSVTITEYMDEFARVVPTHLRPESFVRLAQGVLRRDQKLAEAANNNFGALLVALLDCARLGHEPGTEAFYLVPIKGTVEGWEGYRGVIERIFRAGAVSSVHAEVVCHNDYYDFEEGAPHPVHRFPRFSSPEQRGPYRGVFAYARMTDGGFSRVVEMDSVEVLRHRGMNPSWKRPDSPWQLWPRSMWLKCAVHELEKWVPSSTEYRRVVQPVTSPVLVAPPAGAGTAAVITGEVVPGAPRNDDGSPESPESWPDVAPIPDAPSGQGQP